jgi:two-component system, NtrC family, response regulator HydG
MARNPPPLVPAPATKGRILVVEDRDSLRKMLAHTLVGDGYDVETAANGEVACALLAAQTFALVLTDLKLPGVSGIEVLRAARAASPAVPVLVMTGFGTVQSAVEAMKLGALDFLEKPVDVEDLLRLVAGAVEPQGALPATAAVDDIPANARFATPGCAPIIGRHPLLRAALRLLARVAPSESTVLLTGESGTGKELFARALHGLSARCHGPFVAVNCAAIPETLIESELFGHERGAFTGADRRREGRFEVAAGGTLLLDEVGELPLSVQAKVLRVLEERTFERVGGSATLHTDARLVAATNRGLRAMVDSGEFRADLFFRLDVFPIELPPLRQRSSDVPLLVAHLLRELAARHRGGLATVPTLDPDAMALLTSHPWPGNVRELANLLERAVILADSPRWSARELRPLFSRPGGGSDADRLREALFATQGDKHRAAEMLGLSYRTVARRVKEHDLEGFPKWRK